MSFYFRKITKSKWYKNENVSWLGTNKIQADALNDLSTKGNTLSFWVVGDKEENLDDIIAANAASRDKIANLDFVLLEEKEISNLKIKIHKTLGASPHVEANSKWHVDFLELTTEDIFNIQLIIFEKGTKKRKFIQEVKGILKEAIEASKIDLQHSKLQSCEIEKLR